MTDPDTRDDSNQGQTPSPPLAGEALSTGQWTDWGPSRQTSARDFVRNGTGVIRDVVSWLGDSGAEELLAGLSATLSTTSDQSALPLGLLADGPARRELRDQAESVGEAIAAWARADLEAALAASRSQPPVFVRSHCDGHPWTPAARAFLYGTTGGPEAMGGYNEWLHQLVLLRDALLPFVNWQEVPVLVLADGLRRLETAHERFIAEIMVRGVRHTSIVEFARHVVSEGSIQTGPYGFRAGGGSVLPDVVGHSVVRARRHLLRFSMVQVGGTGEDCVYDYELDDYGAAPRTEVLVGMRDQPADPLGPPPVHMRYSERARPRPDTTGDIVGTISLEVRENGPAAHIDLGQALRGHRFAHDAPTDRTSRTPTEGIRVPAAAILNSPNLVSAAPGGTYVVDARNSPDIALALLGKIYPGNVIVSPDAAWGDLTSVGKSGPAKFVIVNAQSTREERS